MEALPLGTGVTLLRKATPHDLPFIYRGERAYMDEIEPAGLASWINAIDRNLELWIDHLERTVVVDLDGERVAYAMWAPSGEAATLITIHVAHSVRRRGLGAELMGWFAESAQQAGHRILKLGVHRDNPARSLYERSGFACVSDDGDYLFYRRDVP